MKRLLVAVLLAITGCDSPPAPIDAGADGGAADVPVASDGGATDSGIGDGGDDDDAPRDSADAPDAFVPPPPVTVVISDGTAPHEGADVLWYDDADTLLGRSTTGRDGRATFDLPAGGTVVAIPVAPSGELQSFAWVGVQPGDELPIVRPSTEPGTVTTPVRAPDLPGSVRWQVDTECGVRNSFANPIEIELRTDCSSSDVVVSHYDAASTLIGTTSALDQPITPGTELDLSGTAAVPATTASVTLHGLPATTSYVDLSAYVRFGSVLVPEGLSTTTSTPGASVMASGILPAGGLVRERARVLLSLPTGSGYLVLEHQGARAVDLDLAASEMPVLTSVGYSPRLGRVSFVSTGSGPVEADATFVRVITSSSTGRPIAWNVVSPSATEVVLPTLPDDLAEAVPPADASPAFVVFRVAAPGTYDDVRPRVYMLREVSDLLEGEGDLVYSFFSTLS